MHRILVVEDHEKIRAHITSQLRDQGFQVQGLSNAEDAEALLLGKGVKPDLMLLDVRLPGQSGVDLVNKLAETDALPPTIMISGEATISETVEALRMGVYDFIEKPVSRERLLRTVANCLEHGVLKQRIAELEFQVRGQDAILGESAGVRALKETIGKVAPTEGRVLIRGESGTGKELVANMIHMNSPRRKKPFVKINCAAIPPNLIEGELFGHVRGAFTDARADKVGLFEAADGGTLFLDEIGDMELPLQSRLLRVLEDGRVRRVGDNRDRPVNVRVISATNRDLEALAARNSFRDDLFFRISTIPLRVPPLRERGKDIALLLLYYVNRACEQNRIRRKTLTPKVYELLEAYHWPGNIRELKNLAERLVILGGDPITEDDLPSSIFGEKPVMETGIISAELAQNCLPLKTFKAQCEKEYIEHILRRTDWNFNQAAQMLEIQRTYLYQKVNALGIHKGGSG